MNAIRNFQNIPEEAFNVELKKMISVKNTKTIYRDGDKCIKVFTHGYTKGAIFNEALNQIRIEETGLKIPVITEVKQVNGHWAIISEFIQGSLLSDLIKTNPDKADEYLSLFIDIQTNINTKKCSYLTNLRDKLTRNISLSDLDANTRYDLMLRLDDMQKNSFICHGDFYPSNIIIANDGTPYVLDWINSTSGDPASDAAYTYLLFSMHGREDLADGYLKMYCERTGTEVSYIRKWVPLMAVSQLFTANDRVKDFLMTYADITKY